MDNEIIYLEEVPQDELPDVTITEPLDGETPPVEIIDNSNSEVSDGTAVEPAEPVEGDTSNKKPVSSSEPAEPKTGTEDLGGVKLPLENAGNTEPVYTELIQITEPAEPRNFLTTNINDYSVTEGFLLLIFVFLLGSLILKSR